MTRIAEMAAGRAMDALVAEKVMGERSAWYPYYSTDIAAAWPIFERLSAETAYQRGHNVPFCLFYGYPNGPWFVACDYDHDEILAKADTAPLAICRAALRLVKAKVP